MLIDKIPVIRGWLARFRNHKAKTTQLNLYSTMIKRIKETPISSIHFDSNGCVYTLDDGRSFHFNPEKSAGWLYTVPYSGTFEQKETEFVRRAVQSDFVCIDIGACFGWYSVLLSHVVGERGQVHSFEPVPDNRECLLTNLALNHASNVKVNTFALGDKECSTKIYVPMDGVSGSLKAHAKLEDCKILEINVSTLDKYVTDNELNRIDFIKADIEGAEFLMLKGAEFTLRKYRPILMLEVQAHSTKLFGYVPEDLFEWLKKIGYKAYYVNASYELVKYNNSLDQSELPDYNFIFKFG